MNRDILNRNVRAFNGRPVETTISRFWSKVNRGGIVMPHMDTPCWEWTGSLNTQGYGTVNINEITQRAHRVSWVIYNGEIPARMNILHKCDNPGCVRQDHLFIGSAYDNMKDMISKDRGVHAQGVSHSMAKLSDSDVIAIRKAYPSTSQRALGRMHGISQSMICNIVNRKNWKHI